MPRNYSHKPPSSELEAYISTIETKRFDQFGEFDFLRTLSKSCVHWANSARKEEPYRQVKTDTAFCLPLIFWDGQYLQMGGVKEYDPESQTGTFSQQTDDGLLTVEGVHSYHVFVKYKGKYLPCRENWQAEKECLGSIFLSAIVKVKNAYQWRLYFNTELLAIEDGVHEFEYLFPYERTPPNSRHGYVIISKPNGDSFENMLVDVQSQTRYHLDSSRIHPAWANYESLFRNRQSSGLDTWYQDAQLRFMVDHTEDPDRNPDTVTFCFHLDSSKTAQIIAEYAKNADAVEVVPNLFKDDPTINLRVTYENRYKDAKFLYYCSSLSPELFNHAVYGIGVDELERGALNHWREYQNVYEYSEMQLDYLKAIVHALYELCGEEERPGLLPEAVYRHYISSQVTTTVLDNYFGPREGTIRWYDDRRLDFSNEKSTYQQIYSELAAKGQLSPKWKSEYNLFTLVQSVFPDAIYQYHGTWLGRQSLDIFVPSYDIAIEYQGQQHFEAVDYFGGKEALEANIARDSKKRRLCSRNNVDLIEWRYDEPISTLTLKAKLLKRGIDLPESNLNRGGKTAQQRAIENIRAAKKRAKPRKSHFAQDALPGFEQHT